MRIGTYCVPSYGMSCYCAVHYETVHRSEYYCVFLCVSIGLCACAMLLLYLRFSEGWVEVGIFCSSISSTSCGRFVCRNVPCFCALFLFYRILCHFIPDGPYSCLFFRKFSAPVDL